MEIVNGVKVGAEGFNDDRYCLEANNLSDIDNAATAFDNIKQVATNSTTGVSELATDAETVTGTATDRVTTPANIAAKMEAPGEIGGTTPSTGNFTTLEATGQLQGALINNQMVSKATFDILGLMTDPRFLNLQCEDPGAGTMIDVSGQGNDGTYQGSMTSGDRVIKGMGWTLDFDGINDYVDLGDSDNLSLGNGTDDEEVTFFFVCEAIATGGTQVLFSKYNYLSGSEEREYQVDLMSTKQLRLLQFDESDNRVCLRKSDDEISDGYHSVVISSPGTGGATAMDNIKMYIDGILIASTATNNASYVAMENTGTSLLIGTSKDTSGNPDNNFEGNVAMVGMDGSEWSAFDVNRFHQLCKGLYAL